MKWFESMLIELGFLGMWTHMINVECTTAHTQVCTVCTLVRGWLAAAKDQRLLIKSRLGGFIHTNS